MSSKRAAPPVVTTASVSLDRAARLYRLVELLGEGPRTRAMILNKLKIDIRTFYRDLELLRECKIDIILDRRKYSLNGSVAKETLGRLPFPDPCLTIGEAQQLAKGRTKIHKKMREVLKEITG
jgi:hypothetical protein